MYLATLPKAPLTKQSVGGVSTQLLEAVFLGNDRGCGPQRRYNQAGSLGAILVTLLILHSVAPFGFTDSP